MSDGRRLGRELINALADLRFQELPQALQAAEVGWKS